MPLIELKNLTKTFKGKTQTVEALRDVSLSINQGDIYGIIGMSGAGKSTLVRCINFLERPTSGSVIIDGKDLSAWKSKKTGEAAGWDVKGGVVTVNKKAGDIMTKEEFGSFQLHLEWRVPKDIEGKSQARGNSGVFLQGKYVVQILDNYENETYVNGMVGSLYKQTPPLVNPMRKPGEWNVYDIIYTAPVFKEDGTYLYRPRVTVILNGVVVQNNTELLGTTEYIGFPKVAKHGDGPIILQSHGDPSKPISFRNMWIRKM